MIDPTEDDDLPDTHDVPATLSSRVLGTITWFAGAGITVLGIYHGYFALVFGGTIAMMGGAVVFDTPLRDPDTVSRSLRMDAGTAECWCDDCGWSVEFSEDAYLRSPALEQSARRRIAGHLSASDCAQEQTGYRIHVDHDGATTTSE